MAAPRQIAALLGMCATSLGLYFAAQQVDEQPIVVWESPDAPVAASRPSASMGTGPGDTATPAPAAAQIPVAGSPAPRGDAQPVSAPVAARPIPSPVRPASAPPVPLRPGGRSVAAGVPELPVYVAPREADRISASTPDRIAMIARRSSGRVDPFAPLEPVGAGRVVQAPVGSPPPPPLTAQTVPVTPSRPPAPPPPAPVARVPVRMTPPPVAPVPARVPPRSVPRQNARRPAGPAVSGDGLVVTGIIASAKQAVAILSSGGQTRLVQVGDQLPGGGRVISIQAEGKSVVVAHGGHRIRLAVKE